MSDLELEKQEIERLEQELEMKKQQMEFKRQELVQQELYAEQNQPVVPEYQYEVEVVENQEIQTTDKSNEPKFINKQKIAIILLIVCFLAIPFFNQYFAKERQAYYDSIPLILENPEQYYNMTYEDIIEMYGEPNEQGFFSYDMGDYVLNFSFEFGYVNKISYDPEERISFESPADIFYLFGLGDKTNLYRTSEYTNNLFRCKDSSYPIDAVGLMEVSENTKTADRAVLYFKSHPLEDRKVFEDDFSNTEVIYDFVKYLGVSDAEIYNALGGNVETRTKYEWIYHTDIGQISLFFEDDGRLSVIIFYPNEPIKYETSTQEIMVMFGVDPKSTSIVLDHYGGYGERYLERYKNNDTKWKSFNMRGINLDNKTVNEVSITYFKK